MGETVAEHWSRVYETKKTEEVSWYQPSAEVSLALVAESGVPASTAVVDVGAGASTFVDGLLDRGFSDVTLLDLAAPALEATRARLGARAAGLTTVVGDVTAWSPPKSYRLWHDRAVFHFLVEPDQRAAYREVLGRALAPDGMAIVATFAADGPEKCSGLPVCRYSIEALAEELSPVLELVGSRAAVHTTPWGSSQSFVFGLFRRRLPPGPKGV